MARRGDGLVLRGKKLVAGFHLPGGSAIKSGLVSASIEQLPGSSRRFLKWSQANHRPRTTLNYRGFLDQLRKSFKGKMLSEIHPFNVEKHKQARIAADAKIAANRELYCLKNLFYRCIEWNKVRGGKSCQATEAAANSQVDEGTFDPASLSHVR
jgi:hypothetical protein